MSAHILRPDHDGSQECLTVGEAIEVHLPERPSTGHRWQLEGQPKLVDVSHSYEHEQPGVGTQGTRKWSFKAKAPGRETITLVRKRPWESEALERFSMDLNITN